MELRVAQDASTEQRFRLLQRWYRERLREQARPLLQKWQHEMGVELADWGIKHLKTKWGTCSIEARRIWMNLGLAKKPASCLEYIVVHELTHLLERNHNERFTAIMDKHLPTWRMCRKELNAEIDLAVTIT